MPTVLREHTVYRWLGMVLYGGIGRFDLRRYLDTGIER